jgi:hypothetical protein
MKTEKEKWFFLVLNLETCKLEMILSVLSRTDEEYFSYRLPQPVAEPSFQCELLWHSLTNRLCMHQQYKHSPKMIQGYTHYQIYEC